MSRIANIVVATSAILGSIVGASALYFQYVVYGMEAPNITWIYKVPFLTVSFGVISGGAVTFFIAMLEGVLELLDQDKHWPHN